MAAAARDLLTLHINELGGENNVSAAERSIIRRVATITVELEILERKFALSDGANPTDLDLYLRASGGLRRLLEAVGLKRVPRDVSPMTLEQIAQEIADERDDVEQDAEA